jgi:hypothetical protein
MLPKLPKLFAAGKDLARSVYDWVSPAHDLLSALRQGSLARDVSDAALAARVTALENGPAPTGSWEWGPATATLTGNTHSGAPTYRQGFSGSSLSSGANVLIASGVNGITLAGGWIEDDAALKHYLPVGRLEDAGAFRATIHLNPAGDLNIFVGTSLDNNPYNFWVEFT